MTRRQSEIQTPRRLRAFVAIVAALLALWILTQEPWHLAQIESAIVNHLTVR